MRVTSPGYTPGYVVGTLLKATMFLPPPFPQLNKMLELPPKPQFYSNKKLTGEVAKKYIQEIKVCFQIVFYQFFLRQDIKRID